MKVVLAVLLLWQVCYLQSCLFRPTLVLRHLFPHSFAIRPSAFESQLKEGPRAAASISLNVDGADTGCETNGQPVQSCCQTDLELGDRISSHLHCQTLLKDRYAHLRSFASPKPRFYFALDLYQAADILPRLLSSILEAIKFLGPTYCYLSVVEGSSNDGTSEMLYALGKEAKELGFAYSLIRSNMDSKNKTNDRIETLSKFRNLALAPFLRDPSRFDSEETTIVFINDISLCPNDILELVHQRRIQGADMACPMDYSDDGLFYDVWVARSMTGDIFFEIPRSGLWKYAKNLLWDDPATKQRLDAHQPFQVFSCWNGMAAINAKPFVEKGIRFRRNREGECCMGEPTLLCKDFWANGFGRILVVPSVWVAYSHKASVAVKKSKGCVEDNVKDNKSESGIQEMVEWKSDPPSLIKCPIPSYADPQWVPPYEGFLDDYS
ncbi:MAG: hypothetical protein Q9225_000247 [Loekoesia sp. 1 TL-2023]